MSYADKLSKIISRGQIMGCEVVVVYIAFILCSIDDYSSRKIKNKQINKNSQHYSMIYSANLHYCKANYVL